VLKKLLGTAGRSRPVKSAPLADLQAGR